MPRAVLRGPRRSCAKIVRPGPGELDRIVLDGSPETMKILLIESDAAAAHTVFHVLAMHHVALETDPHTAVAGVVAAADAGEPYDLVLCGFAQPGGAGFRLLATLRALREPPVFTLISSYDDAVEAAMFADHVLIKPLVRADVADVVARVQLQRANATTRRIRATRAETG